MLDDAKFDDIYGRYSGYIYTILKSMLYDDDSIEDLIQIVLFKIAKAYPGFSTNEQEKSWIINVTRNVAIDFFRRKNKTTAENYCPDEVAMSYLTSISTSFQLLTTPAPKSGNNIFRRELCENVINKLKNISELDKKIFLLKFAQDLTMDEITSITHIHRSSVYRSIDRTRALICPIIDEYRRLG